MGQRLAAEFIGALWLVPGGCGAAVLAAAFPHHGIHFVGAALAFGLTVLTMINTSVNPARSLGPALWEAIAGQSWALQQVWLFWVAPIAGAALAGVAYKFVGGANTAD